METRKLQQNEMVNPTMARYRFSFDQQCRRLNRLPAELGAARMICDAMTTPRSAGCSLQKIEAFPWWTEGLVDRIQSESVTVSRRPVGGLPDQCHATHLLGRAHL
jgi:hypothetical protein